MIENERAQLIERGHERSEQRRQQQEGIRKRYSLEPGPELPTEESLCNNCVIF